MTDFDEDTCSLTLRRVSRRTSDALYRAKSVTGKPICHLVDEIVAFHVRYHPHLLKTPAESVKATQTELQNFTMQVDHSPKELWPQAKHPESSRETELMPKGRFRFAFRVL